MVSTYFRKTMKYHNSWKSFHWKPICSMRMDRRTDRRTDRHEEANSRFL